MDSVPVGHAPSGESHPGRHLGSGTAGDGVVVTTAVPPQVARHDGYETAFLEMGDVSVRV